MERVGVLGGPASGAGEMEDGSVPGKDDQAVRGVINDIGVFERGEKGKDGLCVVVATGTEHRFGRWKTVKGKNGAVVFEVPRVRLENGLVNGLGNTSKEVEDADAVEGN